MDKYILKIEEITGTGVNSHIKICYDDFQKCLLEYENELKRLCEYSGYTYEYFFNNEFEYEDSRGPYSLSRKNEDGLPCCETMNWKIEIIKTRSKENEKI